MNKSANDMTAVNKSKCAVIDGYGIHMLVDRGHLIIRDGFASEGELRELRFPRGRCEVERIVVRAPAGSISIGALDWCNRMGIAVAFIGSDSRLINCLVPDGPHDGPLKRAQAISGVTDEAVRLAHWLLRRKIESEIHALKVDLPTLGFLKGKELERQRGLAELDRCLAGLPMDRSLVALLSREGYAARMYWALLAGDQLPWPDWTLNRIPEHWARIWPRETGQKSRVRDATDPFNALLNYGYTLLEVETRISCAGESLDPDLGLIHVDDRLRESFVLDLMEPLRALVDRLVLQFVSKPGLRPHMFHELRNGVVRLDSDAAKALTDFLMPALRKPARDLAAAYAAQLRHVAMPYRLVDERKPSKRVLPTGPVPKSCEYCKQPLPKPTLKFCNRQCYLRHSVEVRQPIKKAQERLAELRAQGISPGHGGEAARKRGAKSAESNRRRALGLSPDERRARRAAQARVRRWRRKAIDLELLEHQQR